MNATCCIGGQNKIYINNNYNNYEVLFIKMTSPTTFARATTQHALKKNNKNTYKKTTQTILRLKAKTT